VKRNYDNLDKFLLSQRKKYKVFSYFFTPKKAVVDFLPFSEIDKIYIAEHHTIESNSKTKSYLPRELNTQQIERETKLFPIELFAFTNVYLTPDSSFVITKNSEKIFYEKFHEDEKEIYKYNNSKIIFNTNRLAKIRNYKKQNFYKDETVIFLGGIFTSNYYHFLLEVISKTEFLCNIPNHKNLKIVLDESIKNNSNLKTIAEIFLKEYDILYLDNASYYEFKKIWYITAPCTTVPNIEDGEKYEADYIKIRESTVKYLRETILKNYDPNKVNITKEDKVYIARKSKFRKLNEEDLLPIVEKYGFSPIYFEDLNIHEQIYIFQHAKYIIGASGAAFTNIIFSHKDIKGLILLGSVWGDFSAFSTLAHFVGFDLFQYRFKNQVPHFHADYKINPISFEEQLKLLLLQ